ncbi:MAG TPA: ribosome biogenesis GTP-binding protein YihA/YsxC [Acidobacteriota bacterium]|nr:ribosome biogenesis GTP-binding protein YihA/YsxC [Acidobacteriota bacterium]
MDVEFLTSAFRETQYPPPDRPEVAFAGRSNVGKSSLINALVNRKNLAKTSSTPGRTQSINFFRVGDLMYMVDLPGYGFAKVPLNVRKSWQHMVETYLGKRPNLKAVVTILDIRRDLTPGDTQLLEWLRHFNIPAILVLTKADKVSRQETIRRARIIGEQVGEMLTQAPTVFSSRTRQGRDELWKKIGEIIRA